MHNAVTTCYLHSFLQFLSYAWPSQWVIPLLAFIDCTPRSCHASRHLDIDTFYSSARTPQQGWHGRQCQQEFAALAASRCHSRPLTVAKHSARCTRSCKPASSASAAGDQGGSPSSRCCRR